MPTLAALLIALLSALALTPLVRRLAIRVGALDHALSSRKVHCQPTPRLGGLAIAGAFYLSVAVLLAVSGEARALALADAGRAAALGAGGLIIVALGLWDDLRGLPATTKLLVELGVAGLLFAAGYRIDAVALPLVGHLQLGWLSLPVTLLWIAGVTNAVNLIDGLDGLAAGVAAVAAAATGLLAMVSGSPLVVLLAAALAGAALGFLRHNFNPASIFMGDTGSLFLGFVLAALSLRTQHESSTAVGLLGAALVLGIPLADTALAVARRALRGAPLFRADRGHLHHRLLAGGLGHRGAVLALYAASLVLSAAAILLKLGGGSLDGAVLASLAVACPTALWRLGALRFPGLAALLDERRRNLAVRAGLRRLHAKLRRADDWGDVWSAVSQAPALLGAGAVALRLAPRAVGEPEATYVAGNSGAAQAGAGAALAVRDQGCTLELRWHDREALDRDTEIAVEVLCGQVVRTLHRIRRRRQWARPAPHGLGAPEVSSFRAGPRRSA